MFRSIHRANLILPPRVRPRGGQVTELTSKLLNVTYCRNLHQKSGKLLGDSVSEVRVRKPVLGNAQISAAATALPAPIERQYLGRNFEVSYLELTGNLLVSYHLVSY